MKKWITGATMVVALIGFASQASASVELLPGTTNQAPDVFTAAGFTLLASNIGQTLNSGTFIATASAWVYSDTANVFCAGCLDFVYQVFRVSGNDPIEGLNAGSFAGFRTDAGYIAGANTAPSSDTRSASPGITVSFNFNGPSLTGTMGSDLLVIETNATHFIAGNMTVSDTLSANGSAFIPTVVPEPMTLSMMGIGLLGLGLIRRRQAKK